MHKLLAKVLANQLPIIISPYQGAFVANMQILDGVLMANELIYSRKRIWKGGGFQDRYREDL